MLRLKYLVAACVLALTVGAANANTITVFDVAGTFYSPSNTPLTGTLTIDVTSGSVTTANLVVANHTFTQLFSAFPSGGYFYLEFMNPSGNYLEFSFQRLSASLIGYTGSPFIQEGIEYLKCCRTDQTAYSNLSGSLIAEVTTTPLPAALPLFATGLGALGLLGWRRKRKVAAAIAA